MKKRITGLLLAVFMLAFAFCGCGKDENAGSSSPSGAKAVGQDAEEEFFLDMPEELKGTTVKVATWSDPYSTESGQVIADFENLTGIHFELVSVPQTDYCIKIAALVAADQSPDVVIDNGEFPNTLNFLTPLTPEYCAIDVTDPFWSQTAVKYYTVGKYCYAVESANSTWTMGDCIYYNPTVLEENGVKTPSDYVAEDNWNLDTFWTCMTDIQKSCGYSEPGTVINEYGFLAMFGENMLTYDAEKSIFKNNCRSNAVSEAYSYLLKGKEAKILTIARNCRDNIANGRAALTLYGTYGLRNKPGYFYNMNYEDLAFEYLPKVHKDDANYPRTVSAHAYGICKGAKNPKGAGYYLRYDTNTDNCDLNEAFKNDAAQKMYRKLLELPTVGLPDCTYGVLGTKFHMTDQIFVEITDGTAAQLSTNLARLSNKLDGCVDIANGLLNDCLASQQ